MPHVHTPHSSNTALIATGQYRNLTALPQMPVFTVFDDRNFEHLTCRLTIDIFPGSKRIKYPLFTGQPCDNSRFDCGEVRIDQHIPRCSYERRSDELRQGVRHIPIDQTEIVLFVLLYILARFVQMPDVCTG